MRYLDASIYARLAEQITANQHFACTGNASAWATPELEERPSIMNPFGHGWHLDRAAFDELLRDAVLNCVSPQPEQTRDDSVLSRGVVKGKIIQGDRKSDGTWAVRASLVSESAPSEAIFYAKWLIDGTGRKATLATKVS